MFLLDFAEPGKPLRLLRLPPYTAHVSGGKRLPPCRANTANSAIIRHRNVLARDVLRFPAMRRYAQPWGQPRRPNQQDAFRVAVRHSPHRPPCTRVSMHQPKRAENIASGPGQRSTSARIPFLFSVPPPNSRRCSPRQSEAPSAPQLNPSLRQPFPIGARLRRRAR